MAIGKHFHLFADYFLAEGVVRLLFLAAGARLAVAGFFLAAAVVSALGVCVA
jgi:hypothetical protein